MLKPTGSISQRLLSGSTLVAAGKILAAASALVLNIILTRLLPPEDVGAYYIIISIVTMCALVSQLGVHQAIVRTIAGNLGADNEIVVRPYLRAAFLIVAFGIAIISIPYALGVGQWLAVTVFESPVVGDMAIFTSLWIGGFALQMLVAQAFRGFHRIGYATLFEGASTGVYIVVALTYIWLTNEALDLQTVLIVILGAIFLNISIGLTLLRKLYVQTKAASGVAINGMLKISLPLLVSSSAIMVITELHILILGSFSNEDTVAIYGAAYRLAKFIVVPLVIINSVIPPMIAQFVSQGEMKRVEKILRTTAAVSGVPVVCLLIVIVLTAPNILAMFYGDFYSQGSVVLIILVAAQTINSLTGSPGVPLMMSNRQAVVMRIALMSGLLGIVTSLSLVELMSSTGVALGVGVGLSSYNVGMWAYCKYRLNINTHMSVSSIKEVIVFMENKIFSKR